MSGSDWIGQCGLVAIVLLTTACSVSRPSEPLRTIQIEQAWELQPGSQIAGYRIAAGLGDISIELKGNAVYAPFDGRVQPTRNNCVLFSSPDVPAYLFRLCGLKQSRLGEVQQGTAIGSGDYLYFATLRKQPEGTWAIVEPARDILERTLNSS